MAEDGGTPSGEGNGAGENGNGGDPGTGKPGGDNGEGGDGGGAAPSFHEMLPEDLRENPSLADIKDVGGLAKSYIHGQKLIGELGNDPERLVQLPSEDASEEEIAEFYNKLGRPEDTSGYEINYDEESPARIQGEVVDQFKEVAHKNGLTPKQAQGLMDWYGEWAGSVMEKSEADYETTKNENMKAIEKEFGNETKNALTYASRAAKEMGGEEFLELMDETGLGNDPRVVRTFAKIGEMLAEDDHGGGSGSGTFGKTPAQARAELGELNMNKDFQEALFNPENPGHKEAVSRRQALYEAAYPANS